MAARFVTSRVLSLIPKRSYSAKAAVSQTDLAGLGKEKPQLLTLPNGLNLITQENNLPTSNISIVVKVGSKNETPEQLGVTHCIRTLAGLDTEHTTIFRLTRTLQLLGAPVKVTNNREYTIYSVDCLRTHAEDVTKYLYEIAFESAYKHWQLRDFTPKVKLDIDLYKSRPLEVVYEALHGVAYKGGLSNSLYSPEYMVGKHSSQMLEEFVCQHYIAQNIAMVAQGVDQRLMYQLLKNESLPPVLEGASKSIESKYKGGEMRMQQDLPHIYTAIVTEGVGNKNAKEYLSQLLLKEIVGSQPRIEHGDGTVTKLGKAVAASCSQPAAAQCIAESYTDTGLFGLLVAANPKDAEKLLKNGVATMKDVIKSAPSDSDLSAAKQKLKVSLLMEIQEGNSEQLGVKHLLGQNIEEDAVTLVDSITAADVAAVGAKIAKTKPTMVAMGKLDKVPYLDELL